MHISKRTICAKTGCGGQAYGKLHCKKHAVAIRHASIIMQSLCCHAACGKGEKHEYGEQYCEDCGSACMWRVQPAPTVDA
jgi:hypothetical protein